MRFKSKYGWAWALLFAVGCETPQTEPSADLTVPVTVQPVGLGTIEEVVISTGTLRPVQEAVVVTETRGLLSLAELAEGRKPTPREDAGDPEADLKAFCERLDKGCVGSHQWEKVIDEPDRIGYHYTRCLWAEVYRELGEPELGFVICAGDDPAVRSYNPELGFRRTKVLMNGDEVCDHIFLVEKTE